MTNIKDFLDNFANIFGKNEEEKSAIKETDKFVIDYADGVFCFCKSNKEKSDDFTVTYHGGHNGCIFEDEDYKYLWNNLILKNEEFVDWLNSRNVSEEDMMVVSGEFWTDSEGRQLSDITASFYFYDRRD